MIGFIIGTLCLVALVGMAVRRRRWAFAHGYGYSGCGGRGLGGGDWDGPAAGFGRGGFVRGVVLRQLFHRLETTPGQEKAIGTAVEGVVAAAKKAREELEASRQEVARTISGDVFDEGALGAAYARWDEAIAGVRKAIADALGTAHESLDERQRVALAELITKGHGFHRGYDHPYRSL